MPISDLLRLPELAPAGGGCSTIRLPELDTIPLPRPVVALIDHPHFQRLRRVRQLGPAWLVYPGATHTRFEHSIGTYGTAARYLRSLLAQPRVRDALDEVDVRTGLMAALLHDVGHYPFAHTLEALHRVGHDTPRHEDLAAEVVFGRAPGLPGGPGTLAGLLERPWGLDPERVLGLVGGRDLARPVDRLLASIVSSALDADKMDYLWRDSVHLGVPYGRNYDRERLLNALTVTAAGDHLAVSAKGLVSAEIFLFCRYTMFSEVYWHHAVRSASAMLEQAWADVVGRDQPSRTELVSRLLAAGDDELLASLAAEAPPASRAARLLDGMTGCRRALYKRLVTWSRVYEDEPKRAAYEVLHGLDAAGIERLLDKLSAALGAIARRRLLPASLLLDIPPRDKDRVPDIPVFHPRATSPETAYQSLSACSRVASGIAQDFAAVVKKIRLFVHPELAPALAGRLPAVEAACARAILET